MEIPQPKILSYDHLRVEAEGFLKDHWTEGTPPVDIEWVVDVGLGIDIIESWGLERETGCKAYITPSGDRMRVDQEIANHPVPFHYRFSLAHETAHWVLHRPVLEYLRVPDPKEWLVRVNSIPAEDLRWFEWQANALAGLILVPPESLAEAVADARAEARKFGLADVNLDEAPTRDIVADWIGEKFQVSADVILRRGEYDNHW